MSDPASRMVCCNNNHYPRCREHFLTSSTRCHAHPFGGLGLKPALYSVERICNTSFKPIGGNGGQAKTEAPAGSPWVRWPYFPLPESLCHGSGRAFAQGAGRGSDYGARVNLITKVLNIVRLGGLGSLAAQQLRLPPPSSAKGARRTPLHRAGICPAPLLPAARPPSDLWCISGRGVLPWL